MSRWYRPEDISSALDILERLGGRAQIIQGGTDVMVGRSLGIAEPENWLDISRVSELQKIDDEDGALVIGAGVSLSRLQEDPRIRQYWPILAASAAQTGAPAIQNRATLGGNICNASPAADNAPALLVYNAELEIAGSKGSYRLPYQDFNRAYRQTALDPGEILTSIRLRPQHPDISHYFRKVGTRAAQAISKVALAATLRFDSMGRLESAAFGFASVAAIPVKANNLAEGIVGKKREDIGLPMIRKHLVEDISPQSDIRSNKYYRMEIATRLVWAAVQTANPKMGKE